jgi:hypothetical protein
MEWDHRYGAPLAGGTFYRLEIEERKMGEEDSSRKNLICSG